MGEAWFYQLKDSPLEVTLPVLLDRALQAGWRVAVRGTDAARLRWLDERLWLREGFLPHGLAGGPFDADQPVLLTLDAARPNGAACLMAVDGAEVTVEDLAGLTRAMVLFDSEDAEAARGLWRRLTGAGIKAVYWAEADGRWTRKAET